MGQHVEPDGVASAEKLGEAESYLRTIFNCMNDAIFIHDAASGIVLDINERGRSMYGIPEGSLYDLDMTTISSGEPPCTKTDAYTWIQKARVYGHQVFEWQARHLNGRLFPVEVALRVVSINGKERVIATVRDIADRKEAERALEESELRYRNLFDNLTLGFALHEMIYDDLGNPTDYRYLKVNPLFEKLTGLPAKQVIGHTVKEVLPEIEPYWIENFGRVAQTGKPINFDNYVSSLDIYVEARAFSPEKNQFAVLFADVTERVLLEKELKKQVQNLKPDTA